jgi:hypothetical protein
VTGLHEVIEEALPDLVCLHVLLSFSILGGCLGSSRPQFLDRITVPVARGKPDTRRLGIDEAQPDGATGILPV